MKKKNKIIWLINITLPSIAQELKLEISSGGGWIQGTYEHIIKNENVDLVILFPVDQEYEGVVDNCRYYSFSSNNSLKRFEQIVKKESPNIVHIFGTEYKHTLDMVNVCEKLNILDKTVINIQGLTSIIAKHYYSNLPNNIINGYTFRDLIKRDNIRQQMKKFQIRGENEIKALRKCKNVIGRTDWDKACTKWINPSIKYYFCNETLRNEFYNNEWNIEECEEYSIFVSQSYYPIKGFHYMLEAMSMVVKEYPNAHLYTTGKSPLKLKGKEKIKQQSYGRYIAKLIKKYKLEDKVTFLGILNEKEMCNRYLKSNIFASPSSIENSPNSVGEALLLGVPTISSDVGGVTNLMSHNNEGYIYQHDAPYMLAYYICEIFKNKEIALKFSEKSKEKARKLYSKKDNLKNMLKIYINIMNKE